MSVKHIVGPQSMAAHEVTIWGDEKLWKRIVVMVVHEHVLSATELSHLKGLNGNFYVMWI